jgi:hypothetical protein
MIRETRGNPWCPDCHAHQMVEVKARICQDEVTLAYCTQRTWECPSCDAVADEPDVPEEYVPDDDVPVLPPPRVTPAQAMAQRQIAQAKARGEWRGNNY